jgi:hypothetical protein
MSKSQIQHINIKTILKHIFDPRNEIWSKN